MTDKKTGLELLREIFPAHQISKLPKGTKAQNECQASEKINCNVCGGWHHPRIIHLDYVGHAALTDRLLDADPLWTWEPLAYRDGLPAFDATGGLWIKLTVCGHTRIGYGHAAPSSYKDIGSREKEVIGDALRNAAMRFGAALDLWRKGECTKHYQRLTKTGRTDVMGWRERFWRRVDKSNPSGCWYWTGTIDRTTGYGKVTIKEPGFSAVVHRVSYQLLVGPIPDELFLDHLCHTYDKTCHEGIDCPHRRCVNPSHLEPVTNAENSRRVGGRKTHCPQGHPYSGENLRLDKHGRPRCHACILASQRRSYYKRKALKQATGSDDSDRASA